jgi:uncharacterized protein
MLKPRLTFWRRVGVVLSLIWLLVGGSWGWRHAYDQADTNFKQCVAKIHSAADLQSCRAERARALGVPRGVIAAVVAFGPLAAAWFLAYGLLWIGRRVRGSSGAPLKRADVAALPAKELAPRAAILIDRSPNKRIVEKYMDAFRRSDHREILSCLTDDVEWVIHGVFHLRGKDAFDREIENDAFVGCPAITVTRLTEEGDVVVAEGSVRSQRREGGHLHAVFCDVFEMRDAKIRRLTTYLMELKDA